MYLTVAEKLKPIPALPLEKEVSSAPEQIKPEGVKPLKPLEIEPPVKEKEPPPAPEQIKPEGVKPIRPLEIEPPVKKMKLNLRQIEILERLKTLKKITRKQYAQLFSVSIPTAARDLKTLLNSKLIKARGPLGPGRWYELSKEEIQ